MNQRRLVIWLACCLVNWFCILFVSAEEDDSRMPPAATITTTATTTTTSDANNNVSMDISSDGNADSTTSSQTSEINKTYPEDNKYGSQNDVNDQLPTDEISSDLLVDGTIDEASSTEDKEDQVKDDETQEEEGEDLRGDVVRSSDSANKSHEDQSVNDPNSNVATDSTDANTAVPSNNEESIIEDTDEVERQNEGQDTYPTEGTDDLETESAIPVKGEREELNSKMEQIQDIEERSEDARDLGNNSDEIGIESDNEKKVESNTTSSPQESSPFSVDDQPENEQEDEAMMSEHEVEEQSNSHSESSADSGDERASSTASADTRPETDPRTEEESTGNVTDGDDGNISKDESVMDLDEIENEEGSQVSSNNESSTAASLPPVDESIEASTETEVIDDNSEDREGESQTNESETPPVEAGQSPSESTESVSPTSEMGEVKQETTNNDQLPNDRSSEGSSYRGLWGTPMVGTRPPDMELLYRVFESRIQKELGIGPIPESELRENIFPLGIGYDGGDEEVDTEDDETAQDDDGDGSAAPVQAKLQTLKDGGDVNSDFVEGLDDIDKFFEGVDPPDELDVGATGSSMQDMLVKKGKEILIKRVLMGIKIVREGFRMARRKISARFSQFRSEWKERDIDIKVIAKAAWAKTIQAYEAVVSFVDKLLDFGSDDEAAAEDFEDFKRKTMEELQQQEEKQ